MKRGTPANVVRQGLVSFSSTKTWKAYLSLNAIWSTWLISNTCSLDSYENVAANRPFSDFFVITSDFNVNANCSSLLLWNAFKRSGAPWRFCTFIAVLVWWAHIWFYTWLTSWWDLKEICLPCGLNDPNNRMDEIRRNFNAYVMPTPINIKFKFHPDVRCLLNPMSGLYSTLNPVDTVWRMLTGRNQLMMRVNK